MWNILILTVDAMLFALWLLSIPVILYALMMWFTKNVDDIMNKKNKN